MDLNLRDKVAVITGASVGIELAIANGLAEEGVHIVPAARHTDRLETEARHIADRHGVNRGSHLRCRHGRGHNSADRRN